MRALSLELLQIIRENTTDGEVVLGGLGSKTGNVGNAKLAKPLSGSIPQKELIEGILEWMKDTGVELAGPTEMVIYLGERYNVGTTVKVVTRESALISFVSTFGSCLTEEAAAGHLDEVIDREREIDRVISVLSMRNKNNPVLVGKPGVGKTSIVHGLAMRMIDGSVPPYLLGKRLYELSISKILRGTIYRGSLEAKLTMVLDEIDKTGDIVFIDEIHGVVGAGTTGEGNNDIGSMLLNYLTKPNFRVIGATTEDGYNRFINPAPALRRRFTKVEVDEPTIESTTEILGGIKGTFERYHGVRIGAKLLPLVSSLSDRYMMGSNPDDAITLMDASSVEASSRVNYSIAAPSHGRGQWKKAVTDGNFLQAAQLKHSIELDDTHRVAEVSEEDVSKVLGRLTNTPVIASDLERLKVLESALSGKVVNQSEAVLRTTSILRAASVYRIMGKPMGSLLFLGPPGVGKTYLTQIVAKVMFDGNLLKIDMSEYGSEFSRSRLIGSPPGYIGYKEGGVLTSYVNSHPYCVILFDEIEKAHPDVLNILLGVMNDGVLMDMRGEEADFSNSLICLTSNIGTRFITEEKPLIGFDRSRKPNSRKDVMEEVRKALRPEFIDRLSDVIIFNKLTMDNLYDIIDLELDKLRRKGSGPPIRITPGAKKVLLENWKEGEGARYVGRSIQKEILDVVARMVVDGEVGTEKGIVVQSSGGKLKFKEDK